MSAGVPSFGFTFTMNSIIVWNNIIKFIRKFLFINSSRVIKNLTFQSSDISTTAEFALLSALQILVWCLFEIFAIILLKFQNFFTSHNLSGFLFRSSYQEVFPEKGFLKICSKLSGEHPCPIAISIKLLWNFIEIALWHGCSLAYLLYIFRITFLKNTSGWLLLSVWFHYIFRRFKIVSCFL